MGNKEFYLVWVQLQNIKVMRNLQSQSINTEYNQLNLVPPMLMIWNQYLETWSHLHLLRHEWIFNTEKVHFRSCEIELSLHHARNMGHTEKVVSKLAQCANPVKSSKRFPWFNYEAERTRKLLALSSQTPFYPNKTWAKHAIWEEQIGFAQEGGLLCPPNENRCLIFQWHCRMNILTTSVQSRQKISDIWDFKL